MYIGGREEEERKSMRQTLSRPQAGMLLKGSASERKAPPLPSLPETTKKFLQADGGRGRLLHWSERKERPKAL